MYRKDSIIIEEWLKSSDKALTLAVKGMLPKNSLGRSMITKLKIYKGSEHNNQAQKPEIWEF